MFRYCTATPVLPNSFCASAYITIASAKRYSGVSTSFSIQFTPLSLLRYLYGMGPSARVSCRMTCFTVSLKVGQRPLTLQPPHTYAVVVVTPELVMTKIISLLPLFLGRNVLR